MGKKIKKRSFIMSLVIILLLALVCLYAINYLIEQKQHRDAIEAEYNEYVSDYNKMVNKIDKMNTKIYDTDLEENKLEDSLYEEVISYSVKVSKSDKHKVFSEIFEQYYPTEVEYNKDRKGSFVKIYAMIEKYPKIKKYGEISNLLNSIETNRKNLGEYIETYNGYVDEYKSICTKIKDCEYTEKNKDEVRLPDSGRYPYYIYE